MSSITSISASGMNAASLRLSVAARNIANAGSNGALPSAAPPARPEPAPKPYVPLRVDQVDVSGGTAARVSPAATAPVPVYAPAAPYADANGMVGAPDVDLGSELVSVMTAKQTYAANAA